MALDAVAASGGLRVVAKRAQGTRITTSPHRTKYLFLILLVVSLSILVSILLHIVLDCFLLAIYPG